MSSVPHAVNRYQPGRIGPRYWACRECGSQHLGDEPCARCASDRRLAAAVAEVKGLDDGDAMLAAADAIEDMLYELRDKRWAQERRDRLDRLRDRPRASTSVREVREPRFEGRDRDED